MKHNHNHQCRHTSVTYCDHCKTVYCNGCNQEWMTKWPTWNQAIYQPGTFIGGQLTQQFGVGSGGCYGTTPATSTCSDPDLHPTQIGACAHGENK